MEGTVAELVSACLAYKLRLDQKRCGEIGCVSTNAFLLVAILQLDGKSDNALIEALQNKSIKILSIH